MSNARPGSNGHMKTEGGGQAVRRAVAASQDVAEKTLADLIGQTVAVHLANMLSQLLPRMPWQPSCMFCVLAAKQTVRDHEIACANALAAGEEQPALPEPPNVAQAITMLGMLQHAPGPDGRPIPAGVASVPVCWEHVQIPGDGPRPTGLVLPDGRPVLRAG